MSDSNVIGFLQLLAGQPELLRELNGQPKGRVLAAAALAGYPFTEPEFNQLIWGLEERLAQHRGEPFDGQFPLWQLMWGRYYLEFLALDLIPSITEANLITQRRREP